MRLAILADIHGNLPAFEAAFRHAAGQRPDLIILGGDIIIGSPDSAECWRLARSLGCPVIRGNHERYAAHFGTPLAPAEWSTEQFAPLHWAHAQLSEQERREIGELPGSLRLPGIPDLLIVHASARDDHDSVYPHTPEDQLQAMFAGVHQERYIVRAHNHIGQVRLWERGVIVTGGSVGLPLDGHPTAQYLLMDQTKGGWRIQHQSVPYNVDATVKRFQDTGYLGATGPMGRLFLRELVTATQQMVPFLRLYAQWSQAGPLPLAQAYDRFLNGY